MALRDEVDALKIEVRALEKMLEQAFSMAKDALVRAEIAEKMLDKATQTPVMPQYDNAYDPLFGEPMRRHDAEQEEQPEKPYLSPFQTHFGVAEHASPDNPLFKQSAESEEDARGVGDEII